MNKKYIIITLLFFSILNVKSQTIWNLLNPKPSYNTGLRMHFVSNNTGYIMNSTEILETTDNGSIWLKKHNISSGKDMKFKNSVGYIVGNNGYVIRTIDNGDTWSQITTGIIVNYNSVSVIDENNIILSSQNNLVKSSDGGNTWQQSIIPNSQVIKTLFVNSLTGHAVCQNGTILKTIDGGINWYTTITTNTFPSAYFTIYFIDENIGFATHEFDKMLKTINGGETWTEVSGSFQAIYSFYFVNSNIGYACGEYGAMYKTTNSGNSWSIINFLNGYIDESSMYGIFFKDENNGFATGMRGRIIKTNNGGINWVQYSPTYNTIKHTEFTTNNIGYTLVGNDYFKSTDSGNTWSYISTPLHYEYANGFDFVNSDIGYSIGGGTTSAAGSVYKTTNGGSTWTKSNNGVNVIADGFYAIDFIDENIGFVSGGFNQPKTLKTTNGGNSWQQLNTLRFGQIQFLNTSVGYARNIGNSFNRIYKTIDGGLTWNIIFEIEDDVKSFHFVNENVGYFVGDSALMYKTINGGDTWQQLTIPYEFYTLVKFYSENLGYISDEEGLLYRTVNGGISWQLINSIYRITDINFQNSNIYISGTNGKILSSNLGTLGIDEIEKDNDEIIVYPNPTYNNVNVICNNNEKTIQSISIFDFTGRKILNQKTDNKLNRIEINLKDNSKGMYLLKIILSTNEEIIKKIILK